MGKQSKRKVGKKRGSRRKGQRGGNRDLLVAKLRNAWQQRLAQLSAAAGGAVITVTSMMILQYFMELGGLDSILSLGGNLLSSAGHFAGAGADIAVMAAQGVQSVGGALGTIVQTSGLGVLWCFSRLQSILPNVNVATMLGIGGGGGALYQLWQMGANNDLLPEIPVMAGGLSMDTVFERLADAILYVRPDVGAQLAIEAAAPTDEERWQMIRDAADASRENDEARLLRIDHFTILVSAILNDPNARRIPAGVRNEIEQLLSCPPVASRRAVCQAISGNQALRQVYGCSLSQPEDMGASAPADMSEHQAFMRTKSAPAAGGMCEPIAQWPDLGIAFGPPVDAVAIRRRVAEELEEVEGEIDERPSAMMGAVPTERAPGSTKMARNREEAGLSEGGSELKAPNQGPTPPGSQDTASTVLDTPLQSRQGSPTNSLAGDLDADMVVNQDPFDEEETKDEGPLREEKEQDGGRRRSKKRRNNKKRRSTKKRRQNKRRR
jgi:hypothetical protein